MPKLYSIKIKLLLFFLVILIPAIVLIGYIFSKVSAINSIVQNDIPNAVSQTVQKSSLDSIAQFIRYYDEVLTQSARNYAFTGNRVWRDRYFEYVPLLDDKIKQAISLGDSADKELFKSIDSANLALIALEEQAIENTDNGEKESAVSILEGKEYWDQKTIYKNGLVSYVERRGKEYEEALSLTSETLNLSIANLQTLIKQQQLILISMIAGLIVIVIAFMFYVEHYILKPVETLHKTAKLIAKGNLSRRVETKSKDEIGALSRSFNTMADNLQTIQNSIQQKVEERTKELDKLVKVMTGRELKMIELKKEIKSLKNKKASKL